MSRNQNPQTYSDETPMLEARQAYFRANNFGDDGGYNKKVVWVELGPIPLPVPNTTGRRYAVRFHDLHHILTGYQTDWRGEFEIAGWEVGAGCERAWFAWFINLSGLFVAMLTMPGPLLRAYVRGRNSHGLYRYDTEDLLQRTVGELRKMTGVDEANEQTRLADRFTLGMWWLVAALIVLPQLALILAPIGGLVWWIG